MVVAQRRKEPINPYFILPRVLHIYLLGEVESVTVDRWSGDGGFLTLSARRKGMRDISTVSAAELFLPYHLRAQKNSAPSFVHHNFVFRFFHNRYDFLKYFLTKISAQNTDPISHGALYLIECVGLF
jgi:hypothetical protein